MSEDASRIDETPDHAGAYPRLSGAQVQLLVAHGVTRSTAEGEVLYQEGDDLSDFYVVLSGKVAVVQNIGRAERLVAVHGAGRFLGELNLLAGQPMLLSAVVRGAGEVVAIPLDRLREVVSQQPAIGDLVLRAMLIRRSLQIEIGAGLCILGSRYSSDSRRLRAFVARNRIPCTWIDLERDSGAEALLRELGVAPDETPVVVWHGEQVLRNPSNATLAQVIRLGHDVSGGERLDLIVVGAGPAGLAAAVYGASEGLASVVVEAVATGGQAATSPLIENYLGFPLGISGAELADRAGLQTEKFGARITVPARAFRLEHDGGHHVVATDSGETLTAPALIIATGAAYRRLEVPGIDRFEGTSVYHAATEIEAHLCRGDPVAVVGGGNSAGQATVFLARYAGQVSLLVRHGDLGRDMSRYLVDRVERTPGVEVFLNTEVRELVGSGSLEAMVIADLLTGDTMRLDARALFVFIGAMPFTEWLRGAVELDDHGFVRTGGAVGSYDEPGPDGGAARPLETSRPGIFAAGDVRSGSVKRVAAAVGEGAMAVRFVHEYLAEVGRNSSG